MSPRITRYSIGVYDRSGQRPIHIEEADPEKSTWAIRHDGFVLNRNKVYEPMPSNRDAQFLQECRWSLNEALIVAEEVSKTV